MYCPLPTYVCHKNEDVVEPEAPGYEAPGVHAQPNEDGHNRHEEDAHDLAPRAARLRVDIVWPWPAEELIW